MAALLVIARDSEAPSRFEGPTGKADCYEEGWVEVENVDDDDGGDDGDDSDIEDLPLWVEIKKQVEILREGMEESRKSSAVPFNKPC